jgi:lactate dehydrogenase-like 2-hydroxyacid dehydrogenase
MKKRLLITRRLPDAVEARARATYDVVQHADDRQMGMDEVLDTAKSVDALLITLNEKFRADVVAKVPENIKVISTFSIGFDHIDRMQGTRHPRRQRPTWRDGRDR